MLSFAIAWSGRHTTARDAPSRPLGPAHVTRVRGASQYARAPARHDRYSRAADRIVRAP